MQKGKTDYKAELQKKNVIAFVPTGNSMWPTLRGQKQSVIVKLKSDRLSYFDVGLYTRADGTNVLHRVVEVNSKGYVMVGDSQDYLEQVSEDMVYGVMTGFYRGKKYIDANDPKHLKKIEKWYRRKFLRKLRLKCFYTWQKIKRKFKKD
jgi:hypothetical protein